MGSDNLLMPIEAPPRTHDVSDQALIARTLEGNTEAFERLVQRHGGVVHALARRLVGSSDAQDVAQDAFLRAFNRLDQFAGRGAFRAWLLQITRNAGLTHLARRKTRREDSDPATEEMEDLSQGAERRPAAEMEIREREERLQQELDLLRPEHRAVLTLRDLEGYSYEEIAETTMTPIGTVKGRLHRARGELIGQLRDNAYDWELPDEG